MTTGFTCKYCDDEIHSIEDVIIDPKTDKTYHPNCARILMENNDFGK